ncbi:hypothetical protein Scep_030351 [Stephania cephalantha]|uniref:Uncharacterized protein n=1 Tax=Stephania cephalantha TaxID=152367 RepID=A0AAP0HIK1_9MAGN
MWETVLTRIPRQIKEQLKQVKRCWFVNDAWRDVIGEELMKAVTWQALIGAKCNCDVLCMMIHYVENADWKKAGRMTWLSSGRVTCGGLLGLSDGSPLATYPTYSFSLSPSFAWFAWVAQGCIGCPPRDTCVMFALFAWVAWNSHQQGSLRLPTGPLRVPIFGNLLQLGPLPHRDLASFVANKMTFSPQELRLWRQFI